MRIKKMYTSNQPTPPKTNKPETELEKLDRIINQLDNITGILMKIMYNTHDL